MAQIPVRMPEFEAEDGIDILKFKDFGKLRHARFGP
jgi:hypothetical protein